MRQRMLRVCGLALVAMVASVGVAFGHAQETDPLAGTTVEALGGGSSDIAAGHGLALLQLTLEPGTVIPAHSHPGDVVLYVQSGTFTTTFVHGSGTITRATTAGTPAATEPVTIGTASILNVGDSVSYGSDTAHIMANEGDEPLILLAVALFADGEPGFMFMDMGTPAP